MSNAPNYFRHSYEVSKRLKNYVVYSLDSCTINLLTDTLRIEDYFNKSNATGIKDYLTLRTSTSWKTSEKVTGLRSCKKHGLYYGDRLRDGKKSLLIFQFSKNRDELIIDVYRSFYPKHNGILKDIISKY